MKKILLLALLLGWSCVSCAHVRVPKGKTWEVMGAQNVKIVFARTVTLKPGDWSGFCLGKRDDSVSYLPEVTYIGTAPDGFALDKIVLQHEYNGPKKQWYDVLRIGVPESAQPLRLHLRVLKVNAAAGPDLKEAEGNAGCCH